MKSIFRYGVLHFGEEKATAYYRALVERFQNIAEQPYLYPVAEHLDERYHRSVCGRESIYYRVENDGVDIIRIIGQQHFAG